MIKKHLDQLKKKHITVIGDVMLDVFSSGRIERQSPEAPVSILDVQKSEDRLGGALNVCLNLHSLGVNTEIIGVVGDDFEAFRLEYLCDQNGIKRVGLYKQKDRITTSKTRYFNGTEPILRIDQELRTDISKNTQDLLLKEIQIALKMTDALILQDYNKGVLTRNMISEIMHLAKKYDIPVFVDPKFDNVDAYQGATLLKPNKSEAEAQLGYPLLDIEAAKIASKALLEKFKCKNILLTLGNKGMILRNNEQILHIPAKEIDTADITGAGDSVIAVLAALYSTELPIESCAHYANQAAGETCKKYGVVPVTIDMLF